MNLAKMRKEKDLTQRELAKQSGVSLRTIMNIEQGITNGSKDTWKKINQVLER